MASIIFWLIILPEFNSDSVIALIPLSLIPIFLCCLFTIVFTVFPFFWFHDETKSQLQIFKRYFPYYAIVSFFICCFSIHQFNYELFALAFFTAAFFTLLQTWIWVSKKESK
jgi:branched-subunit amino acid transport protein AzlD